MRAAGALSYLLTDHLGSTAVTTDAAGAKAGELRYYAYGATRTTWGVIPTDRRFAGQPRYATLGLDYFGARWYDPALGRFIQPDTIVPEPGNPSHGDFLRSQVLNRYSYALNNPLRYTDPTGHSPQCAFMAGGGPLGAIAALVCEIGYAAISYWPQIQALATDVAQFAASGQGQLALQYAQQVDAAVKQAAANTSNAGNTADPGGLDPNDPFFRRLIQQTGETDPIKATARASVEGPARDGAKNGVTVLGRYPTYVNTANDLNANYLNFVKGSWDKLTDAQRWAVNKQFLDDAIARGDTFKLASLVDEAKPGTYFRRELEYLISLGYQVVGDLLVKIE